MKLDLVGKPVDYTNYRSMIGSLMYLTLSRPDIMFATCMCARYQENPNEHHVLAVKRIFRYLKGTINLGLWYLKDSGFDLTAYSDADHAGCHLDIKTKYEYVVVSGCCAQVLWMRTQLTDYGFFYDKVLIYCNSKSDIAISCNSVQHTRTKHIDVRDPTEVIPIEFALMAMSSSSSDNEVYDDSYSSKSYRKNTKNLTTKISKLREELFDSESDLCNYKRGLSQVEARLVEFKINESKFCEKIRVLERNLELRDYKIENLTNELEKVKKERDGVDSKLEKFVNSSKNLDQMLETQRSVKDKTGLGLNKYSAMPPPPAHAFFAYRNFDKKTRDRPYGNTFGETFGASIVPAGIILAPKVSPQGLSFTFVTNFVRCIYVFLPLILMIEKIIVIYQSGPFVDAFLLTGKSTLTNSLVAVASVIGQEVDGDASITNTCDDEPRRRRIIKTPVHICSQTRAHMFSERALCTIVSFYTISLTTYQVPQQIHLHI
ncbi:hypothetical protein Tco_1099610 [Tanacetum coccineum]